MFIAHIPTGYLMVQPFRKYAVKGMLAAALLGSIFPDLDLFYFYLIDGRQHHHHSYWIHFPIVWLSLLAASGIWLYCRRKSKWAFLSFVFSLCGTVHIMLDCIVGDIMLFAPFSRRFHALDTVKAVYDPWWLNFILHWSFLLEIVIVIGAAALFAFNRKKGN